MHMSQLGCCKGPQPGSGIVVTYGRMRCQVPSSAWILAEPGLRRISKAGTCGAGRLCSCVPYPPHSALPSAAHKPSLQGAQALKPPRLAVPKAQMVHEPSAD
jgi:hypothetical protein